MWGHAGFRSPPTCVASLLLPSNKSWARHILPLPGIASLPLYCPPNASLSRDNCWPVTSHAQVLGCPLLPPPSKTPTPRPGQWGHSLSKSTRCPALAWGLSAPSPEAVAWGVLGASSLSRMWHTVPNSPEEALCKFHNGAFFLGRHSPGPGMRLVQSRMWAGFQALHAPQQGCGFCPALSWPKEEKCLSML